MTAYRITWEIDVDADGPVEAAAQAWELATGHGSTANVFTVELKDRGPGSDSTIVDLGKLTCGYCGRSIGRWRGQWVDAEANTGWRLCSRHRPTEVSL